MSITKEKKQELIKSFNLSEHDTGSVEVQCAILTERITNLTEHMKKHSKDFHTRRGLLILVSRRRHLLSYLKQQSEERYNDLIAKLQLRK